VALNSLLTQKQLIVGRACSSSWYTNYWGYYWGRLWAAPRRSWFRLSGCSSWRTALAFTFIGSILWLLSGCLVRTHSPRMDIANSQ
jgi:hypothetical protein